jgi:hypothetical protein
VSLTQDDLATDLRIFVVVRPGIVFICTSYLDFDGPPSSAQDIVAFGITVESYCLDRTLPFSRLFIALLPFVFTLVDTCLSCEGLYASFVSRFE